VAHGENFKLGFEPERLNSFLRQKGYQIHENINAPDLKANYFRGQSSVRPVTPVFWFVHGSVDPVTA
jgi:O-methyltransferase involved in polyketide biosynthesis